METHVDTIGAELVQALGGDEVKKLPLAVAKKFRQGIRTMMQARESGGDGNAALLKANEFLDEAAQLGAAPELVQQVKKRIAMLFG